MSQPYAEVIGDPVAHSKSPIIHQFWLDALGIDARYECCHVTPADLAGYFSKRRDDVLWRGCNITLPHKETALAHVADPGNVRSLIGAANLVTRGDDGTLIAANTDAGGFYLPIADLELAGAAIIVIGAGGAARAVLYALSRLEVAEVTIINRNTLKAGALLARFGLRGKALPLGAPLPPAALVVNASALGMAGQPPLDVDLAPLPGDAIIYDIVYAPVETPLLAAARARGLETVDGLEMLVGQAAIAFEVLFGTVPPRDDDAALRALLAS